MDTEHVKASSPRSSKPTPHPSATVWTTAIGKSSRVFAAAKRLGIAPAGSETRRRHGGGWYDVTLWFAQEAEKLKAEIAANDKLRAEKRDARQAAGAAKVQVSVGTVQQRLETASVAAILGVSRSTVCTRARRNGTKPERQGRGYTWSVREVCAMDGEGLTRPLAEAHAAAAVNDEAAAVSQGLASLQRLNRFAYGCRYDRAVQAAIYDRKNRFVELLYRVGQVERVELHTQTLASKPCFCVLEGHDAECGGCGGSGIFEAFWGSDQCRRCDGTGICPRCGGDGIYLAEKVVQHHCFYIAGGQYSFHQPTELVTWPLVHEVGEPKPMPAFPEHREHGLRSLGERVLDEMILDRAIAVAERALGLSSVEPNRTLQPVYVNSRGNHE